MGGSIKLKILCFIFPFCRACRVWEEKLQICFGTIFIIPKVTVFYETQWLLAETFLCSFIPHLSRPLFVFHCPENRLQPSPRLNSECKLEDEIFLGLWSAWGVVAGRQNGENVWIPQISILSSHQLDRMKMEPFSGSRFTLVIALRGTHDGKNLWILQIKTWSGETRMEIADICNRS